MNKSKAIQACRAVSADQAKELQAKFHLEQDLFDDLKNFGNKWSSIEKEYSQALSRLATTFKTKREFPTTPILSGDLLAGNDYQTVTDVWKVTLEKIENLSASHMTMSDSINTEIAETAKSQLKSRPPESKKMFEVLNNMHDDIYQSTRTLAKSKKAYCELEHEAGLCRRSHMELKDRLSNKTQRRFFDSKAQLEKKLPTLESKLDLAEKRTTHARNEYLLSIESCNAANDVYFKEELPTWMERIDGSAYAKFQECLGSVGRITSEAAQKTQADFDTVQGEASKIDRQYNVQCFLHSNSVMTTIVSHDFAPYKEDPITSISLQHEGEVGLTLEARKLAQRIAQCTQVIEAKTKEMAAVSGLHETYTKNPELGTPEARQSADDTLFADREKIRRANNVRIRAKARLDGIDTSGISTQEWLRAALDAEKSLAVPRDKVDAGSMLGGSADPTPSGSTVSINQLGKRTSYGDASLYDEAFDDFDQFEDDDEHMRKRAEFDTESEFSTYAPTLQRRGTVMYDYTAQTDEEVSVSAGNDVVVVVSSGDGWVKVQLSSGSTGYVPESYVEEERKSGAAPKATSRSSLPTVDLHRTACAHPSPGPAPELNASKSMNSLSLGLEPPESLDDTLTPLSTAAAVASSAPASGTSGEPGIMLRALYSYEATEAEELTFDSGAIIRLLRKDDGVDDGWWEGEFNGNTGVFPSLVVEELSPEESRTLYASWPDANATPMVEQPDPFAAELTPVSSALSTLPDDYV